MTEKVKRKSAAPAAKRASASVESAARAKETSAKTKKAAAKKKVATPKPAKAGAANAKPGKGVKAATTRAKPTAERVKERASKTSEAKPKAAAPAAKARKTKAKVEVSFAGYGIGDPVVDPVGDTTDGEGRTYTGEAEAHAKVEMEAFRADTNLAAMDAGLEAGRGAAQLAKEERARQAAKDEAAAATDTEAAADFAGADEAREPGKLERLQKILSKAGVASRRRAEEMIVAGRVMVNGQVVTTLGSKADATRDHIRVDGKLLHGAERHRYFLLNKPKGFVTTVSDPEGRPTVMQFFAKMHERVYPVGRLDYQSEGLLLMTNDGELANLLTKAGSGVEKTYLVKVAGQPSEAELERLRGGVAIEKSEKGSEHVQTAPARIHQVRHGDNPWYEVVLTEGRNRELRKMFAAIGHFAEKIRRVGYGPLVLDVEPGKMRELSADEVNALRLTAEGRIKPRRVNLDRVLPKEAGIATEKHFEKRSVRGGGKRFDRPVGRGNKAGFGGRRESRPFSGPKPTGEKRGFDRPQFEKPSFDRLHIERATNGPEGLAKRTRFEGRKPFVGGKRPFGGGRPASGPKREFARPKFDRPRTDKPGVEKRGFDRPRFEKRTGEREASGLRDFVERPKFDGRKPFAGGKRPFGGGRPSSGAKREFGGPHGDRPRFDRPGTEKPRFEKRGFEKRSFDRPRFEKPGFDKPGFGGRPGRPAEGRREDAPRKPFQPQGDRAGGFNRPNSPNRPGGSGRPKPGFGGRPGGFGGPRRDGDRGAGRPGGRRSFGGRKRG